MSNARSIGASSLAFFLVAASFTLRRRFSRRIPARFPRAPDGVKSSSDLIFASPRVRVHRARTQARAATGVRDEISIFCARDLS